MEPDLECCWGRETEHFIERCFIEWFTKTNSHNRIFFYFFYLYFENLAGKEERISSSYITTDVWQELSRLRPQLSRSRWAGGHFLLGQGSLNIPLEGMESPCSNPVSCPFVNLHHNAGRDNRVI